MLYEKVEYGKEKKLPKICLVVNMRILNKTMLSSHDSELFVFLTSEVQL